MAHKLGRNIAPGDILITALGEWVEVVAVEPYPGDHTRFNPNFGAPLVARGVQRSAVTIFENMPVRVAGGDDRPPEPGL